MQAAESTTLFSESFASGQGGFTIIDTNLPSALTYIWKHDPSYGMTASAYVGQSYEAESWLISPAVDLSRCTHAYVTYQHAAKFQNGNEDRGVTVWAAVSPTLTTINESEWTQLQVPSYPVKGTWNFSSTGQISLQELVGNANVQIAIRYNSTVTAADTYEMKNFNVVGIIGQTFTITAQADDPSHGNVIGGGAYVEGMTTTITATAKEGYNFSHWNDGNTSSTRNIIVNSDKNFIAYFTPVQLITYIEAQGIGGTLDLVNTYGKYYNLKTSNPSESKYYLTGIVSGVSIDTAYKSVDFYLQDATGSIQVYHGKGLQGAGVSFYGQIQRGDSVTVIANLQRLRYYSVAFDTANHVIYTGYTEEVELVNAYLVFQNNHYVNTGGAVYQIDEDGNTTVTNKFNLLPTLDIRSSIYWEGVQYSTTKITSQAFANSQIEKLVIPSTIQLIEEGAFKGCSQLSTVISTSVIPPTAFASSFEGISNFICTLYVPAESIEAYRNAVGWSVFQYIMPLQSCRIVVNSDETKGTIQGTGTYLMGDKVTIVAKPQIGYQFAGWSNGMKANPYTFTAIEDVTLNATFDLVNPEHVAIDTNEVVIEPFDNTANIIWPDIDNAVTYELIIRDKFNNVICTIIFNANGQLTSIAFHAPARSNNAPQQTNEQVAGFSFTITGLETATKYGYTLVAKDAFNNVIETYTGTFVTEGYVDNTIYYTITFVNYNGEELQVSPVLEGEMPAYTGETPNKPEDEQYTYTFNGWSPAIVAATADATYTAVFEATSKSEGFEDVMDEQKASKILRDGQIFILRGEKVFSVTGLEVKQTDR